MSIRIVPLAAADEPQLSPDTVWDGLMGDLAPAGTDEPGNVGGLRAKAQLATAVLLCLMTDRAADPSELRDGDEQRGWPGDAISLTAGAEPDVLGSKLWLLRRRTVDDTAVPQLAELYAREALQTLLDQGACAAIEITATADPAAGRLDLTVTLRDHAGAALVAPRFAVLWEQSRGLSRPLAV
jgi:phage gp46-like protein